MQIRFEPAAMKLDPVTLVPSQETWEDLLKYMSESRLTIHSWQIGHGMEGPVALLFLISVPEMRHQVVQAPPEILKSMHRLP